MRLVLSTVLDLAGAALIVAAVAVVFWPAALFTAGAFCLAASWKAAR